MMPVFGFSGAICLTISRINTSSRTNKVIAWTAPGVTLGKNSVHLEVNSGSSQKGVGIVCGAVACGAVACGAVACGAKVDALPFFKRWQ
jgi:hypothetical protein